MYCSRGIIFITSVFIIRKKHKNYNSFSFDGEKHFYKTFLRRVFMINKKEPAKSKLQAGS